MIEEVTNKMVEAAWRDFETEGDMRRAIEAALFARVRAPLLPELVADAGKLIDIVELVRRLHQRYLGKPESYLGERPDPLCHAAADAIEELVEALKRMTCANPLWKDHENARAVLTRMGIKL